MKRPVIVLCGLVLLCPAVAFAGPPFISDDPEPVDTGHSETFLFTAGSNSHDGMAGASGVDFNYGFMKDAHLNIVVPYAYDSPAGGKTATGIGNVEVAVKYRFLHQETSGWDVAFYPRVFVPGGSRLSDARASAFLPVWAQKDWGKWSGFGGGGCFVTSGRDAVNSCLAGWAMTRQAGPWQLGAEIVHQTADAKGGRATTALGAGVKYDINDHYHLLAYAGPNLQNVAQTVRYNWYASLQMTF
ncbi:MAG: transporter [Asticcacaulis sp.]